MKKTLLLKRLTDPFFNLISLKSLKRIYLYYVKLFKFRHKLIFSYSDEISIDSSFEGCNKIYPRTFFTGSMGYGSYVGPDCKIKAHIGRFSSIAPFVRVNEGVHPYKEPFVSTSPMFFSTRGQTGASFANRMKYNEVRKILEIGSDVWICENVFISGGVVIGDGAVILPGAVVSSDIPPYAIAGGVPAKVISYRYDEKTIEFLLKEKWWNKEISWIKEHWELFNDLETFKKVCHEESNA